MRLDQLLTEIGLQFERASGVDVLDMTLDSRKVADGSLFVAIKGSVGHGMDYVDSVISSGASAILYDDWDGEIPKAVPALYVPEIGRAHV